MPEEEFTTYNIPYGRYLGYPECCVQAFGDKAIPVRLRPDPIFKHCMNGYVPCVECAKKLDSGELSKQDQIDKINSKRQCTVLFSEQHTLEEQEQIQLELWKF